MHWKCMEADRADGAGSKYKVLEAVKAVRTCQNLLGRNGTCLGLLLLLVGSDGDEFGGQAFMEHYNALGQVCVTLQHSLPSCGQPYMGGLVLGGLVLHSSVYHL
jgi:hypothetical protein